MAYTQLIANLNRRGMFHVRPGLDRTRQLLLALGNPHEKLRAVHIAGTNGKGSVAAALEGVLRASGYSTGFYTSPHLVDIRERIQIDGQPIAQKAFEACTKRVLAAEKKLLLSLTYFEFLTCVAFLAFEEAGCEAVVLETGLGGQWDSTNVVPKPDVTVITSIGLDHQQWLGTTEKEIAVQKAGIIKRGVPVVCGARGAAAEVIESAAIKSDAPVFQIDRDFQAATSKTHWDEGYQSVRYQFQKTHSYFVDFGLIGAFQAENVALAVTAINVLREKGYRITPHGFATGLRRVFWPGRMQITKKGDTRILLDGAHNLPAVQHLIKTLQESPFKDSPKRLVFSAYRDKDVNEMLALLTPLMVQTYLTPLPGSRTLMRQELEAMAAGRPAVQTIDAPAKAFARALKESKPGDVLVVTGSLSLVGIVLKQLRLPTAPKRAGKKSGEVHV